MKLNIKARLRHKTFIVAVLSLLIEIASQVSRDFFNVDISGLSMKLWTTIDLVLILLVILGIVIDPTTNGINDSKQALKYNEPRKDD